MCIRDRYKSSQMLLGIINDILDYSKIEAGQFQIDIHNFYLDEVLEQIRSIFSEELNNKGLELYFRYEDRLTQQIEGDSLRLSQILTNLIGNAIKFTDKGYIELNISTINKTLDDVHLKFEVKDTGIGIEEEKIKKLFKAFSQGDASTTRKYGGTGLGLFISSKLVNAMGGHLYLDSKVGVGSNFYFDIPFKLCNFSKKYPVNISGKALVVDDQITGRLVIKSILENYNIEVVEAESGLKAIELIRKAELNNSPFTYIFIDWKMPGELNGIDTIKKINLLREKGILSNMQIPTFIVSAYNRKELGDSIKNADAFLPKPIISSSVYNTIVETINKKEFSQIKNSIKPNFLSHKRENKTFEIPNLEDYSLLLVEDNVLNKEVAKFFLNKTGIKLSYANNGKEAIEMVERSSFDIVLMDLQMPVMDGYEASKIITKKYEHLPIIALSAAVMEDDKKKSFFSGMKDHLTKPINEVELYTVLEKWLLQNKDFISGNDLLDVKNNSNIKLKGFDTDKGLHLVDNDELFYKKLLINFKEQLKNEFLKEVLDYNTKSFSENKLTIHTLKGLSATVGAINLEKYAKEIDILHKKNENVSDELINNLYEHIKKAIMELENIQDISLTEEKAFNNSILEAHDSFKILIENLKNHELVEDDILLNCLELIKANLGEDSYKKFKHLIDNYDFKNALLFLDRFSDKIGVDIYGEKSN